MNEFEKSMPMTLSQDRDNSKVEPPTAQPMSSALVAGLFEKCDTVRRVNPSASRIAAGHTKSGGNTSSAEA